MIVYNVTTKINPLVAESWLAWHTAAHIPETMATGLFDNFSVYQLLGQDDTEGPTYITQYFTSSLEKYQKYHDAFLQLADQQVFSKWGDSLVSFRTIMKSVR